MRNTTTNAPVLEDTMAERPRFVIENGGPVLPRYTASSKSDTIDDRQDPVATAVWIAVWVIFLLSAAACYVLWARVTSAWPFSQ